LLGYRQEDYPHAGERKNDMKKKKHNIIARCGRYALLLNRKDILTPYVVACGYDNKTGEWNQGYYFAKLSNAAKEYEELSGYACTECPNVNDGCVICKRG